jgi:hypothetical protein
VSACPARPEPAEQFDSMGTMSIQLAVAFAVTWFAGTLMFMHGVSHQMLERRPTRCRACGGIPRRTCTCRDD